MTLPESVRGCIRALEEAGYVCYCVGGCVRDACLGLEPQDYDLCTDAPPEAIQAVFRDRKLVLAGIRHGTVGVVWEDQLLEITTFRAEGTYADGRHPNWVSFVSDLNQDLARRDFTINAMAYAPGRGLQDPFGGRRDLDERILRTVGDPQQRFSEDALRILRGVRFAVRFRLTVEPETRAAMFRQTPALDALARERVFGEMQKLLLRVTAADLLEFAPVITRAVPELAPTLGFDQRNHHHAYDVYTHIAHVTAGVPGDPVLRWAALLHDVGKVTVFTLDEMGEGHFKGHAKASADLARQALTRLKAPTELRESVVRLVELHMTKIVPTKPVVKRWLGKLGPVELDRLLTLQAADMGGKGKDNSKEMAQIEEIRELIREIRGENACFSLKDLALKGQDILALGYRGPQVGAVLRDLLAAVMDERVENTSQALLAYLHRQNLPR